MSRYITEFTISSSATDHMRKSYIKRKCGDLLYEALRNNDGIEHYPVRFEVTSELRSDKEVYHVLVDVIDAPLIEATYR